VTPTAEKPIPPKTEAKLFEAQGYLRGMESESESSDEFRRLVANFLTAARSVKDVLVNELSVGDTAVKKSLSKPIAVKMKADPEMDSLVSARNAHIHDGDFKLHVDFIEEAHPRVSSDPGLDDFWRRHRLRRLRWMPMHRSRVLGMAQAVEYIPRAFFVGISNRDAYSVCAEHLKKVRAAAHECVQLYG
jgi:hypothetical protein